MNQQVMISSKAGIPLPHFWNVCVGTGQANEGLRANWLEHLKLARTECSFKYVLFDCMLEAGARPFVELGFCPSCFTTAHATTMCWNGDGSPPNDYAQWAELVDCFVRHCVARYGLDEVRRWYVEVWNEPKLDGFFRGTRHQYFELYRMSINVIKAVDSQLKVGGPATSNFVPDGRFDGEREELSKQILHSVQDINVLEWKGVWIEAFLPFCVKERLPVDFLSTHPSPTDFALDGHGECRGRSRSVNSTRDDLRWVIDASQFPKAENHIFRTGEENVERVEKCIVFPVE